MRKGLKTAGVVVAVVVTVWLVGSAVGAATMPADTGTTGTTGSDESDEGGLGVFLVAVVGVVAARVAWRRLRRRG